MNYEILAVDTLDVMPSTNEQVQKFTSLIKEEILSGRYDFKKFLQQKNFIEKSLAAISDDPQIKSLMIDEIEKYGKDGVGYNDLKFTVESRRNYDYSQTNDSTFLELEAKKKEIEAELKARQKFLQTIQKPVADPETGELIYPASVKHTTYIKSSTKK